MYNIVRTTKEADLMNNNTKRIIITITAISVLALSSCGGSDSSKHSSADTSSKADSQIESKNDSSVSETTVTTPAAEEEISL